MNGVETKIPGLVLRPGARADVPAILGFIRELAEYERLAHEVEATEVKLAETLFGSSVPTAEVVIAELEGAPVGFALFFTSYSTFLARPGLYLEDLYVQAQARSRGIGRTLLKYLASLARERGYGRFEWSVLDWNEPALAVYRSIGAQPLAEWTVQRLEGAALAELANRFDDECRA